MTKDYARRTVKKKTRAKKISYFLLWVFTILLFLAFTIGLVCLGKYKYNLHRSAKITKTLKVIKSNNQQASTDFIKTTGTPQFDFYSILQQKKINPAMTEYVLNIIPTTDYATANHIKAKLILLGYTASIASNKTTDRTKYRVIVGPYDNKESALDDQKKLLIEDNFHSFLKKPL